MLRKKYIGMFLGLILGLSACTGTSEVEVVPEVAEAEEVMTATPAEAPSPPTATQVEQPTPTREATCVPNDPKPSPSSEIVEIFSPDLEEDWIKGPENAAVTLVEYGDFQ